MPFDRLVSAVDAWAGMRGRTDVFAQIGTTDRTPSNIEFVYALTPDEFRQRVESARVVVGHAGMGTIISALQAGKPVIILPRLGDLRETRNDHQCATAQYWGEHASVQAAMNDVQLVRYLDEIDALSPQPKIGQRASDEMISTLRSFIADDAKISQ